MVLAAFAGGPANRGSMPSASRYSTRRAARSRARRFAPSAGNEPQLLPDGWWEIEIPAAKIPIAGRVTLWAEHPEWGGSRGELVLGKDPNPRVELHLKEPESRLRGQVVDGRDHVLEGVRIFLQDGGSGEARTDGDGRFELKLGVPPKTRVGLRAEYPGAEPQEVFCYAGRDGCSISLRRR